MSIYFRIFVPPLCLFELILSYMYAIFPPKITPTLQLKTVWQLEPLEYLDIFNHDLFLIIFYFVQVLLLEPVLIMSMAVLLESNAPSVTSSSAPPEWLEATPGMFHVTLARLSNVLNVIGTTNTKRH